MELKDMIAEIDLLKNNKAYIIKDGRMITHDLPDYGEVFIVTVGGKVDRLETKIKRKV